MNPYQSNTLQLITKNEGTVLSSVKNTSSIESVTAEITTRLQAYGGGLAVLLYWINGEMNVKKFKA